MIHVSERWSWLLGGEQIVREKWGMGLSGVLAVAQAELRPAGSAGQQKRWRAGHMGMHLAGKCGMTRRWVKSLGGSGRR